MKRKLTRLNKQRMSARLKRVIRIGDLPVSYQKLGVVIFTVKGGLKRKSFEMDWCVSSEAFYKFFEELENE